MPTPQAKKDAAIAALEALKLHYPDMAVKIDAMIAVIRAS